MHQERWWKGVDAPNNYSLTLPALPKQLGTTSLLFLSIFLFSCLTFLAPALPRRGHVDSKWHFNHRDRSQAQYIIKNPTKSENAIKLQMLQFWCHWSLKQSPCYRQMHWLGISCWRMHRRVRGKVFFKGENNKIENSASWRFSWNTFHSFKKKRVSFRNWHLRGPFQTLLFSHIILESMGRCTCHTKASQVWPCLALGDTLMGQISCSSSSSADKTAISHVGGTALQFMSRTMAISTIAFCYSGYSCKSFASSSAWLFSNNILNNNLS